MKREKCVLELIYYIKSNEKKWKLRNKRHTKQINTAEAICDYYYYFKERKIEWKERNKREKKIWDTTNFKHMNLRPFSIVTICDANLCQNWQATLEKRTWFDKNCLKKERKNEKASVLACNALFHSNWSMFLACQPRELGVLFFFFFSLFSFLDTDFVFFYKMFSVKSNGAHLSKTTNKFITKNTICKFFSPLTISF